jgi:hypothetical protein
MAKYKYVKCRFCGKRIRYQSPPKYLIRNGIDPARLKAIRRHYKRQHPKKWREIVEKAVRTRKERRERAKKLGLI